LSRSDTLFYYSWGDRHRISCNGILVVEIVSSTHRDGKDILPNIKNQSVSGKKRATYQEICRHVQTLTPDEQLRLLEELAGMVRQRMLIQPKCNIMDLEGLGKDIWHGLDAQEYVNQERAWTMQALMD